MNLREAIRSMDCFIEKFPLYQTPERNAFVEILAAAKRELEREERASLEEIERAVAQARKNYVDGIHPPHCEDARWPSEFCGKLTEAAKILKALREFRDRWDNRVCEDVHEVIAMADGFFRSLP